MFRIGRSFFCVITFAMFTFCAMGIADDFFDSIPDSDDAAKTTQQSKDEKKENSFTEGLESRSNETFSVYPEKNDMNLAIDPNIPISYSLSKDGSKLFIFNILNMKKLQTYQLDEQINLMNINLTNKENPEESNFLLINYRKKLVIYNIRKPKKKQIVDDVYKLKYETLAYYESYFSNKLNIIYINDRHLIYKKLNEQLNFEIQDKCSIFKHNKINNNKDVTRKIHNLLLTESNGIIVAYTDNISNNSYLLKCKVVGNKIKKLKKLHLREELTALRTLFTRNTQAHLIIVLTNNKNKTFSIYAWKNKDFWGSTSSIQPYVVSGQVKVQPLVFNTESHKKVFKYDNYLAVIAETGSSASLKYFQLNPYKKGKNIFLLKHSETIDIQDNDVFFNFISPYGAMSTYIILLSSDITIYQNELTINHQWKLKKKPVLSYKLPSRGRYQFYVRSNPHLFDRQNYKDYYLIINGQEELQLDYEELPPDYSQEQEEIASWMLKIQVDKPIDDPVKLNFLETQ